MNLAGVGLSVVDHAPREIARVTLGGLHFARRVSEREQVYELTIGSAQVDNQLLTTTQPVVLIKAQVGAQGGQCRLRSSGSAFTRCPKIEANLSSACGLESDKFPCRQHDAIKPAGFTGRSTRWICRSWVRLAAYRAVKLRANLWQMTGLTFVAFSVN